jgi:hypothetical protein
MGVHFVVVLGAAAAFSSLVVAAEPVPTVPSIRMPTPVSSPISLMPQDPDDARTYRHLEALFGADTLVRDFERFTTERGEAGMLVLLVSEATEEHSRCYYDEDDPRFAPYMGCDYDGVTWLTGAYSAGLVIDGKLINRIPVFPEDARATRKKRRRHLDQLPLTGLHLLNAAIWGQGEAYPEGDPRNSEIERTTLMKLADYNCDGHAWEFRLARYAASGHIATTLVGYSAKHRKVILYRALGDSTPEAPDNFFPSPNEPGAEIVHYHFACPQHGSDIGFDRDFIYDPEGEVWRVTWEQEIDCNDGPAWNPPEPYGTECAPHSSDSHRPNHGSQPTPKEGAAEP